MDITLQKNLLRFRNVGDETINAFKPGGKYEGQATEFYHKLNHKLLISTYEAKLILKSEGIKHTTTYIARKLKNGTINGYKFSDNNKTGRVWIDRVSLIHAVRQGLI